MMTFRLRLMSDDGRMRGRVIPTTDFRVTQAESGTPTISFTVSEKAASRYDTPFVVALEDATREDPIRDALFMVDVDEIDDRSASGSMRFTGEGFLPWMLARTYLHWTRSAVNGERTWTKANPGAILSDMIAESRLRGWGPSLSFAFTKDRDSTGTLWAAGDRTTQQFRLLTPISTILGSMNEQGLCDWYCTGTTLHVVRLGAASTTRDTLVFGGPGFTTVPTSSTFKDVFTHLTVVPEKARNWLYLTNGGASDRFGRLEATLTQSGVEDHETATKLAQPALEHARAVRREFTFEWQLTAGMPRPYRDFNIGDIVLTRTRYGNALKRIVGIQVTRNGDGTTFRAIMGDKLVTRAARNAKRVNATNTPGAIGGSGVSFPITNATYPRPKTVSTLRVESNTARWADDGTAHATVKLAWDAVTTAEDESAVDVNRYELAVRTDSGEPATFASTEALTVTVTTWEPGVNYYVTARAVGTADTSVWSPEILVLPAVPASIVPRPPTKPVATANKGTFRADGSAVATITVTWAPVTLSVEDVGIDIDGYEVTTGLNTTYVTEPTHTFTIPADAKADVRVRARSTMNITGDPSPVLTVTGNRPDTVLAAPTVPKLEAGLGGIAIRWDGKLAGNVTPPPGFGFVFVDVATTANGPWETIGTPLTGAGGTTVPADIGDRIYTRLRSVDTLARIGGTSPTATITAVGVPFTALDPDIVAAIEEALASGDAALATTDGKNRIYVSTGEPAGDTRNLLSNASFEATSGNVEVYRNLAVNPNLHPSGGPGAASNSSAIYPATREVTPSGSNPQGILSRVKSQRVAGATGNDSYVMSLYNPDGLLNTGPARNIGAWFYVTAAGYEAVIGTGPAVPLPANAWTWVNGSIGANVHCLVSVGTVNGSAAPSTVISYMTGVTALTNGIPKATIAGGVPYPSIAAPDPDLTPAWMGSENNSESRLIGKVPAVSPSTPTSVAFGIQSSKWKRSGQYSLRQIPTYSARGSAYTEFASHLRAQGMEPGKTYTILGTFYQDAPTSVTGGAARTVMLTGTTTGQNVALTLPDTAGAQDFRMTFTIPTTGSWYLRLYNGGQMGDPDVYWDDLAVVEGEYAGPFIQKFTQGDIWWVLDATSTSIESVKMWNGTEWVTYLIVAEKFIATGSITSPLVKAGTLTVNNMEPTFGDELGLSANSAVSIIVGTLNEHDQQLSGLADEVGDAQTSADAAADAAGDAQASANGAMAAAGAAQRLADDVNTRLETHQTYYRFTATGLAIGDPGALAELRLQPDRIEMTQNNVVVSYWEGGVFVADEARLQAASIGNHKFEAYGAGRTIIRPL